MALDDRVDRLERRVQRLQDDVADLKATVESWKWEKLLDQTKEDTTNG